jgi:Succinyl-CoA ligase like flavodoxin domain
LVPPAHFNASFARMPGKGDLAVISHSGAIVAGMIEWAAQRAIGFSAVISVGDQVDVRRVGEAAPHRGHAGGRASSAIAEGEADAGATGSPTIRSGGTMDGRGWAPTEVVVAARASSASVADTGFRSL